MLTVSISMISQHFEERSSVSNRSKKYIYRKSVPDQRQSHLHDYTRNCL